MSNNDPHVQVFHFTSKISNAKIKKYQVATSRGMSHPEGNSNSTPPADASPGLSGPSMPASTVQQSPGPEASLQDEQAPPRKRLKLHVRQPGQPQNARLQSTPAKAAASPAVSSKVGNLGTPSAGPPASNTKIARDASSDLSSLHSSPAPEASASTARNRGYGDFMSYYILDNEDDGDEDMASPTAPIQQAPSAPPSPPKAQPPPQSRSQQQAEKPAPAKAEKRKRQPRGQASVPQPKHPANAVQHAPSGHQAMPPIAIPRVILIDLEQEPRPQPPGHRETVRDMINKLQVLSEALGPFAGMPGFPRADPSEKATKSRPSPWNEMNLLDGFLDMFESTDDETEILDDMDAPIEDFTRLPGSPDSDLIYGIQFIMNALRSWAHQRLQVQFNKQFIEAKQKQQAEKMLAQAQPKRGPGRPRKFSATSRAAEHAAEAPGDVHMSLDNTPEGHAVRAFQEVLRSGCLQINGILPAQLTQALTHIYMQIDRLINHGNTKDDPNWHPVSYICQIEANRMVVEKWKEDQARIQEVSARQQQLNDQNIMAQMRALSGQHHMAGVAPSNHSLMTPQQVLPSQREQAPVRRPAQAHPTPSAPPAPPVQTAPPTPTAGAVATVPANAAPVKPTRSAPPPAPAQAPSQSPPAPKRSAEIDAPKADVPKVPAAPVWSPVNVPVGTPVPTPLQAPVQAVSAPTPAAPLRNTSSVVQTPVPAPAPPARAKPAPAPTPLPAAAVRRVKSPAPKPPKSKYATAGSEKRKASGSNQAMSNIKMYMPGWQPQSGAQMKFSYAPTAQPPPQQYHMNHGIPPHGLPPPPPHARPMSMQPPNAPPVEGPPARIHSSPVGDEIVVASAQRNNKSTTPAQNGMRRASLNQAEAPVARSPVPGNGQQGYPPNEGSSGLGSTSTTVSRINNDGPAVYTASRFPHPGAVIVDQ